MSKVRKMEPNEIMKFLSTVNLRNRGKTQSRRKSMGQRTCKLKSYSKNRRVLRPANINSRYMSVTQDDSATQRLQESYSFQPVLSNLDSKEDDMARSALDQVIQANKNVNEEVRVEMSTYAHGSNVEDTVIVERNTETTKQMSSCKKRKSTIDDSAKKPKIMIPIKIDVHPRSREPSLDNNIQFEIYEPEHRVSGIKRGWFTFTYHQIGILNLTD